MATGILYPVSTPIGNLEDITFRAVRTLREADLIACEDTRHTSKLLQHYGIDRPTISYHEHNESERSARSLKSAAKRRNYSGCFRCGYSADLGPGISPGFRCDRGRHYCAAIPGASALLTALAASGRPRLDQFHLLAFCPPKTGQRRKELERLADMNCTVVLYEAPHRIVDALEDIGEVYGDAVW